MYKIYVNETPLFLVQNDQLNTEGLDLQKNLLVRYNGTPRALLSPIDMLENTRRLDSVTIYFNQIEKLIKDFESLYKILEAGGGIVANPKGQILTMFRRNTWDLPKGKIDKGETKEAAAIREVQEETGIQNIDLGEFLLETNHTYKNRKGKRIIKRTYWYAMTTADLELSPQTEEDIELCEWMLPGEFLKQKPIYKNIKAVVNAHLNH